MALLLGGVGGDELWERGGGGGGCEFCTCPSKYKFDSFILEYIGSLIASSGINCVVRDFKSEVLLLSLLLIRLFMLVRCETLLVALLFPLLVLLVVLVLAEELVLALLVVVLVLLLLLEVLLLLYELEGELYKEALPYMAELGCIYDSAFSFRGYMLGPLLLPLAVLGVLPMGGGGGMYTIVGCSPVAATLGSTDVLVRFGARCFLATSIQSH
jgi:hypothetical protein